MTTSGLLVHGTLWVLVEAINAKAISEHGANALVTTLRSAGARFPKFPAGGILTWAEQNGLLDDRR